MLDFIYRIRKFFEDFDPRKMTPWQLILGGIGILFVIWIVAQILNLILGLVPFIVGGALLYFGYQWLQSRDEDLPEEARKTKAERTVDEAMANIEAANEAAHPAESVAVADETASARASVPADNDTSETIVRVEDIQADDDNLSIKQIVNPETGFKEPDISRLIEQEEKKLEEADRVTEDVMAQLEARRQRLREQQKQNDES